MHPILFVNDQFVDVRHPALSALDRGFTLGDGVFETMKFAGDVLWYRRRHLTRLRDALQRIGISPFPEIDHGIDAVIDSARAQRIEEMVIRVTVSRGTARGHGLSSDSSLPPTVTVVAYDLPAFPTRIYDQGISAHIASAPRNERSYTAGIKTTSYIELILALHEANAAGNDDALLLDTRGFVAEGSSSNVFAMIDGTLCTPAVSCGVRQGVTREVVMTLARKIDMAVAEREITVAELERAEEIFLTSSLRDLAPLVRIGHRAVGAGAPGPVTRQLMWAYAIETDRV